jgi:ABC-2 type transport system ATP-binding protein
MIIETQDLSKSYGSTSALKGITLNIEAGGVVGLLGPNGAGKTTLVETFEGLRAPSSGRVSVLGLDPTRQARLLKERIGVQLQSTSLPQDLNPFETLRLFGAFFNKSLPPAEVLERVGLTGKMKSRNHTLSGGQRQRLAIAMALVNDPELLILDEPTSGLDPVSRREIHSYIADQRASKRTVLLSTHYIEEAEKLCDRVILLRAGEIVADGSPAELVSRAHSAAATLFISIAGEFDSTPLLQAGVVSLSVDGENQRFTASDPNAAIPALGELLQSSQARIVDLQMKRPSLEDIYIELIGEASPEEKAEQTGSSATDSGQGEAI